MKSARLGLLVLALAGCDDGASGGDGTDAGPDASACAPVALDQQPRTRFAAGETFWLATTGDCTGWTVVEAPAGVEAAVEQGEDGYSRFTPVEPGTYRLQLDDGVAEETITVVSADSRSFHNLNYYPGASIAQVGDEIWVADVFAPRLTRLTADLQPAGSVATGPWPVAVAWNANAPFAVVAQRGNDTLGLVDVAAGRLVDALWVGDEPSNVVLSPDGQTAYVALATEAAVAVVDLATRAVRGRVTVGPDPLALALSPDGSRLYVAGHRTGHPERPPYDADPADEERDVVAIDTASLEVVADFGSVGTTLNGLLATADRLYVSGLRNDTAANLANPDDPSFEHVILALNPESGAVEVVADLLRQESSGGHAVTLHGMALTDEALWVAAEGSDQAVALDPTTLAELRRVDAPGRPRALLASGDRVFAHGVQGFTVSTEGMAAPTGADPRPEAVARGQRYFTGAGRDYGANWSCNSCHADGLTDTLIWNAGPFESRLLTRPFFWLEGTWPLGWSGYLSSVTNYAYTVNTNIGIRPTTQEATDLATYIGSIMPPPAANGWTERDGSFSADAEAGRALYDAQCASCHALPLTTSRQVLPTGITEGVSGTPALVGIYRHQTWLKRGEARTLEAAVAEAMRYVGGDASEANIAALTRFVSELTGRDLFVLDRSPRAGVPAAADQALQLTFSLPVHADDANRGRIRLEGPDGPIDAAVTIDGRHVSIQPAAPLANGAEVQVVLDGVESEDERVITGDTAVAFTVAAAPALRLEGEYVFTVDMPLPRPDFSGFNPETTIETRMPLVATATAGGANWLVDYGEDLTFDATAVVVDGETLRLPALPIPVGPSFSDSFGAEAALEDTDGDGVADAAAGTLRISGPGFDVPGVTWRLGRPEVGCPEGADGDPALMVDVQGDGMVIRWEGDVEALGLYVTDPGVQLPLGPGTVVTGGETAWALTASNFPMGFASPVTYGEVPEGADDTTEANGGPAGGAALEPGRCYQVSVITTRFMTTTRTLVWPEP